MYFIASHKIRLKPNMTLRKWHECGLRFIGVQVVECGAAK